MAMMVVVLFPFGQFRRLGASFSFICARLSDADSCLVVCFSVLAELVSPILVGRWSNSGNALLPWITGYPFRLFVTLLGVGLVATFPEGELTYWFYARVLAVQLVYSLASNVLFVSQCSFFAQVCDSSIGGTYMTLLNTIANLGSSWPKFFVFAAVDLFTCKSTLTKTEADATTNSTDPLPVESEPCYGVLARGMDGFYIISFICFAIGIAWYFTSRRRVLQLGAIDKKFWSCS
jgi:PAT family acetyl-CoA transporter-like MFS transporter 1